MLRELLELVLCRDRSEDLVLKILAVPKSAKTKCQFSLMRMLLSFKSLCTMFFDRRYSNMLTS